MNVGEQALQLYERSENDELIALGERTWQSLGSGLPEGIADMCFFVRNGYLRREDWAGMNLWEGRTLSMAVMTGSSHTIGRLLLRPAFVLVEMNEQAKARLVLEEMLRVVDEQSLYRPVFERMFYEKTAYCYLTEKDFGAARRHYEIALRFCDDDPRGRMKVRGAMVLTSYLENSEATDDTANYSEEMAAIIEEAATHGYLDVADAARANLDVISSGTRENFAPFELT